MTFPGVPLTNQWTAGETPTAVQMNARIDARLNAIAAVLYAIPTGNINNKGTSGGPTLVNTSGTTGYVCSGSGFTFTVPTGQTWLVQAGCHINFNLDSTGSHGNYSAQIGYQSGSSINYAGATMFGPIIPTDTMTSGANGRVGAIVPGSAWAQFAAGQWTIAPFAFRNAGTASDVVTSSSCWATNMGGL